MNYQNLYNKLVERGQERILEKGVYYEKHHILPKCMGGLDNSENLVKLTAREHFLCHWLLCRIYPENSNLSAAFWLIVIGKQKRKINIYIPSSRIYEEAKINYFNFRKGKTLLEKTKQKISIPLLQFDLQDNFIKEWPNSKEVDKILHCDSGACARGEQQTAGGFKWKFKYKNKRNLKKRVKTEKEKLLLYNKLSNNLCKLKKKDIEEIINLLQNTNLLSKKIAILYKVDAGIISSIKLNISPYNKKYDIWYKENLNHIRGYKYSEQQIKEIISLLKENKLTQKEIGKLYKTDNSFISQLKNNKSIYNKIYKIYYV